MAGRIWFVHVLCIYRKVHEKVHNQEARRWLVVQMGYVNQDGLTRQLRHQELGDSIIYAAPPSSSWGSGLPPDAGDHGQFVGRLPFSLCLILQ